MKNWAVLLGLLFFAGQLSLAEQSIRPESIDHLTDLNTRIEEARKTLGPNASALLPLYDQQADLYSAVGRHKEALESRRRSLSIVQADSGKKSPAAVDRMVLLAGSMKKAGDRDAAQKQLEQALSISQERLGQDHVRLAPIHIQLAELAEDTRAFPEAEQQLKAALDIYEKTFGSDHIQIANVYTRLGSLWNRTDKKEGALYALKRAMEIAETELPSEHPALRVILTNGVRALESSEKYNEAVPLMEKAILIAAVNGSISKDALKSDMKTLARLYQNADMAETDEAALERFRANVSGAADLRRSGQNEASGLDGNEKDPQAEANLEILRSLAPDVADTYFSEGIRDSSDAALLDMLLLEAMDNKLSSQEDEYNETRTDRDDFRDDDEWSSGSGSDSGTTDSFDSE